MERYELRIKASATKEIEALPKNDRRRVVRRIGDFATAPRPVGSEKLGGHENSYRVRQGVYRIVYTVDDVIRRVEVVRVRHRKDVYR